MYKALILKLFSGHHRFRNSKELKTNLNFLSYKPNNNYESTTQIIGKVCRNVDILKGCSKTFHKIQIYSVL